MSGMLHSGEDWDEECNNPNFSLNGQENQNVGTGGYELEYNSRQNERHYHYENTGFQSERRPLGRGFRNENRNTQSIGGLGRGSRSFRDNNEHDRSNWRKEEKVGFGNYGKHGDQSTVEVPNERIGRIIGKNL